MLNIHGEVIGINTMTVQGGQGISFAIPIDSVKTIGRQLLSKGFVSRPFIGTAPAGRPQHDSIRRREDDWTHS